MVRGIPFSSALIASSLFFIGCPADEPPVDGGVEEDAGVVDAGPQDAGVVVDAGPTGCGAISAEGTCDGNVVTFCDTINDELVAYDCGNRELFPNETTQCVEVTDEYGVDCTVAPGEECAFFENGDFVWILCRGTEPACLEADETFTCIESAGTCDAADVGTCDGGTLLWSCAASQPFLIDCASYGGACSAVEQACVDLPAGETCDDDLFQCSAGLECVAAVCVDVGADDAGTPADGG